MDYFLIGGLVVALIIIFKLHLETKRMGVEINKFERRSREHAVRMAQRVTAVQQEYEQKQAPDPKNRVDFE